jgi:wobble nucleotide-excising tRNase
MEKALLAVLTLPSFPLQQFRETLAKQLTNVSAVAEQMVREHLSQCMGENIETWVSDGLASVKENTCPFCSRSLQGVELIEAYNKYFSTA